MKKYRNNLQDNKAKVLELQKIKCEYKKLIESDLILRADFDRLVSDLNSSSLESLQNCKKILKHLNSQINQAVEDDQRMDDESPRSQGEVVTDNNQSNYLSLKKTMNGFYKNYIKSKS
jgi:hypothetical protein